MQRSALVLATLLVACAAGSADAQAINATLSPAAVAIACAPPPSLDAAPAEALRIVGSQDGVPRSLFGDRDLLVLSGGTSAGLQIGQQFFIRRTMTFGASKISRGAKTLGWVRIVAVNDSTAIGSVDHVCGAILTGDYLEPFVAVEVPADAGRDEAPGQPDFTTLGHIMTGNEDRYMVGAGDFALIDWGENQGLMPGSRFAIFRDVGVAGLPLASIGEGVVISTSSAMALTRVIRANDAVYTGDYIALRR
jgi:hypothetical protein